MAGNRRIKERESKTQAALEGIRRRDVDVFCNVLSHEGTNSLGRQRQYLKELSSDHARSCAKRILKKEALVQALLPLLRIKCLWPKFLLKVMHKVVSMKCLDEVLNYLKCIEYVYITVIADGDMQVVEEITEDTIQEIQGKFPLELGELIDSGQIFGNMPHNWRQNVFDRLRKLKILIPSFFTFFKDVLVLEEVSKCMQHLVELEEYDTITLALKDAFVSQTETFTQAYRRLFLFARLRFQDMPISPRRDPSRLLAKTRPSEAKESVLYEFAKYAADIGFSNTKINKLIQDIQSKRPEPSLVHPYDNYSQSGYATTKYRCGFPDTASFEIDKRHFTFGDLDQIPFTFEGLQSLHILGSVFCSFFIPPDNLDSASSNNNKTLISNTEEITVEKVVSNNKTFATSMEVIEASDKEVTMKGTEVSKEGGMPQRARKRRRNSKDADDLLREERNHSKPVLEIKCFFPKTVEVPQGEWRHSKPGIFFFRPDVIVDTLRMLMQANGNGLTLHKIIRQFNKVQLWPINPDDAIRAAAESGANTIILVPKDTRIDENLLEICASEVYNIEREI